MGSGFTQALVKKLAAAPDLELAMALAEDVAQELGGDVGAMLADKGRAWRKVVPSPEMIAQAERLGIDVVPVMQSRASGKAGRLSDLIDKVTATRVIDPVVAKIKERV
jgi:carbamate kinase